MADPDEPRTPPPDDAGADDRPRRERPLVPIREARPDEKPRGTMIQLIPERRRKPDLPPIEDEDPEDHPGVELTFRPERRSEPEKD